MEKLLERLDLHFDEAGGRIRIVDADWFADDLKLSISINVDENRPSELWEIECGGVIEDSLCSESTQYLNLSADSPLLKPFVEPIVDITFSENAVTPALLLGIASSSDQPSRHDTKEPS
jgi:hypothetical protein